MNANKTIAEVAQCRGTISSLADGEITGNWEGVVRQLVSNLRFGIVQITVHESHVVQVERTEKVRFAQAVPKKPSR